MTSVFVCFKVMLIIAFPLLLSRLCEYILQRNIVWYEVVATVKHHPHITVVLLFKDLAFICLGLASYLSYPSNGFTAVAYTMSLLLLFGSSVTYLSFHDLNEASIGILVSIITSV
ncbi:hypothetical protein ACOME3_001329 [Neoechinorhynchus agilis]